MGAIYEYHDVNEQFASIWRVLARAGWCDAYGGMEYMRVWGEWVEAGRPRPIARFIRVAANAPAPPASTSSAPEGHR